jgi:hypothetical protein
MTMVSSGHCSQSNNNQKFLRGGVKEGRVEGWKVRR